MENLRVLLVDDEPLLLESLEIILKFHKIEIIGTAPDSQPSMTIKILHGQLRAVRMAIC